SRSAASRPRRDRAPTVVPTPSTGSVWACAGEVLAAKRAPAARTGTRRDRRMKEGLPNENDRTGRTDVATLSDSPLWRYRPGVPFGSPDGLVTDAPLCVVRSRVVRRGGGP